MKLTIKSGESIENALDYLRKQLEPYKDDFPLLKGNMNVYVTLEGFGHKDCPDNTKELVLSGDEPIDMEKSRVFAARKQALDGWERFYNKNLEDTIRYEAAIESDIRYIETAEEKGRKPENVEKRKKELLKNKAALQGTQEKNKLLVALNERVLSGNVEWLFNKQTKRNATYDYTLNPILVFKGIENRDWHFVYFESRWETPYGTLREGLPYVKE